MSTQPANDISAMEAYDKDGAVRAIIETPKAHRNKYTFEPRLGLFELTGVLPAGAVFPFDFGFIPSTLGGDGDPMDVLVLMDEPAYPGCLIPVRLIGILKARQISKKEDNRNDRLIAVHTKSRLFKDISDIQDLPHTIAGEITHFFVSYNQEKGVEFKPLGMGGPADAKKLLNEAIERFAEPKKK